MKKTKKLNKAEKRHITLLSSILILFDPDYGEQQPLDYYDYELLYGDIDINNDAHRIVVIRNFLIENLRKSNQQSLTTTKNVLLLAIKYSDSKEVEKEFLPVESIPFDRIVKDKRAFIELIYRELFNEDPSMNEYNQNYFHF